MSYLNLHKINDIYSTVGLYFSRFQPLHIGHTKIINYMSSKHEKAYIVLVKGSKSSEDKRKNPFDIELQLDMLNAVKSANIEIVVSHTGFIPLVVNEYFNAYNTFTAYCGEDRKNDFIRFSEYLLKDNKLLNIDVMDFDRDNISGTLVRKLLIEDKKSLVLDMIPKEIHKFYDNLRKNVK